MRRFVWFCAAYLSALAYAGDAPPQSYPLWDGHESIADYAKRVDLPPTKTLDLGNGVKLELVLIPAGKFIMGTPEPESPWIGGAVLGISGLVVLILLTRLLWRTFREHRRPQFSLRWLIVVVLIVGVAQCGGFRCWRAIQASRDYWSGESPAHEVALTKPYYIGKHEVTQEQYAAVMGTNPSQFKGPSLPVETVSWDDATEFCKKASEKTSEKTSQAMRLPTEAEWEYACRAGTETTYNTGDSDADLDKAAWYGGNSKNTTHPVGQKTANAWGVHDMHGNVWEWCQDYWQEQYKPEAAVDPQGSPQGQYRVLRGGAWDIDPRYCRSAIRDWRSPGYRFILIGFRVVAQVPPPSHK
jgi:formylglycine-generating enzyme required for sulfatase activity